MAFAICIISLSERGFEGLDDEAVVIAVGEVGDVVVDDFLSGDGDTAFALLVCASGVWERECFDFFCACDEDGCTCDGEIAIGACGCEGCDVDDCESSFGFVCDGRTGAIGGCIHCDVDVGPSGGVCAPAIANFGAALFSHAMNLSFDRFLNVYQWGNIECHIYIYIC